MTVLDKVGTAYTTFVRQLNKRTTRYLHTRANMEALAKYIAEKLGEDALTSSDTWLLAWSDLSSEGKLQEPPTAEEVAAEKAQKERDRIAELHERDRARGRESRVFKSEEQREKEAEAAVRKVRDNESWLSFWPAHRAYMSQSNAAIMDQWLQDQGRKVSVDSLEAAFKAVKNQLTNLGAKPEEATVYTALRNLGDVNEPFTQAHLVTWLKKEPTSNIREVRKIYPHLAIRIDAVLKGFADPMTKPAGAAGSMKING